MIKKIYPKNLKVWDEIWISDRYFYDNLKFNIFKAFVYRKIWGEASYKISNLHTYETEFSIAFPSEEDAKLFTIKELKRYKKYRNMEIDKKISLLKDSIIELNN